MWPELIAGAWLVGQYIYHRLTDVDPTKPGPAGEITVPSVTGGDPIPLIYGRCRVRAPILAWLGTPHYYDLTAIGAYLGTAADIYGNGAPPTSDITVYGADMLFTIGIGLHEEGNAIHSVWAGEQKLVDASIGANWAIIHPGADHLGPLTNLVGDGGAAYAGNLDHIGESNTRQALYFSPNWANTPPEITGGMIEFHNGHGSQLFVDYSVGQTGTGAPNSTAGFLTQAGARMSIGGFGGSGNMPFLQIPGYRTYLTAFLYGIGGTPWLIGSEPQVPAYSFEVSSYPSSSFSSAVQGKVGLYDLNPMDAAYDIITDYFGKMGYGTATFDSAGWAYAANILMEEGNGYSRAIEAGQTAAEVLMEIQQQIDGIFYEKPDGTICVKLIRGDYNPGDLFQANPDNCIDLEDVAFGGWQDIPTRIVLKFMNRNKDYIEDSVTVQNQANAVGQDNQVNEIQLSYPGVCDPANALAIANRELYVRTRPIAKCKAIFDRSAIRLNPGDAIIVNFPKYNISNMVFRVAKAPRGTLMDGKMTYDLIQDPYYVWRGRIIVHPFPIDILTHLSDAISIGF